MACYVMKTKGLHFKVMRHFYVELFIPSYFSVSDPFNNMKFEDQVCSFTMDMIF